MTSIPPGRYRHFEGEECTILGVEAFLEQAICLAWGMTSSA